jgi:aryl-alcohol dehydrogenase-like predicted oxidoreductase
VTDFRSNPIIADAGGGMPGLTVARIALGCGNFGGVGSAPQFFGQGLTEDQALELMDAAWARQLRSSLDRLGVDRVDLYLAHDYDPAVPLAETFGAFSAAQADGLIEAYGVSNFDARQLTAALADGTPRAIQNSYSLLTRQDEQAVLPLCAARGVAYLAFGPLAGGWLTGKYRRGAPFPAGSRMTQRPEPYTGFVTDRTFEALARLQDIAVGRGTSMAGLALAWLLADDRVTQIVIGPGRPEHLAPAAEALAHPVSEQERGMIDEAVANLVPKEAGS